MTSHEVILLTGVLCASACALLGTFLILRRTAMMADAISHAILPGIVFGYYLADGPSLLFGFLGAALASTVTVTLVAALQRSGRVDDNALGTVLVSKFFANVHLDTDAVLYGNIEFSNFERLIIGGRDMGPQSLWIMSTLLVLNLLFLGFFYKELKVTTFDAALSASLGFSPVILHYALMAILSMTTVGAFTAVGAILVIALIVVPAATAYLLTDRLAVMIGLSVVIGALSAVAGYQLAIELDASISGSIVTMTGVGFLLALLFSPSQGMIAKFVRRRSQSAQFALELLLVHLFDHQANARRARRSQLAADLAWPVSKVESLLRLGTRRGLLSSGNDEEVALTPRGVDVAQGALAR
jgi:manganese/zinc/iron transport system permease protein